MAQSNLDKLRLVAGKEQSPSFAAREKYRRENEEWLEDSFKVAVLILQTLRQKGWTQKQLADEMQVSPQQVNKWIKGTEHLQTGTIRKLQKALGVQIMQICEPSSNFLINVNSGKTSTK